jgi:hypothetical protein
MKKVFVTLAVGMLAASAFAQGTLVFANNAASTIKLENAAGVPASGGQVQFAWAAVGASYTPWTASMTAAEWTAANAAWTVIGTPVNVTPTPGRFSGGTITAGSTGTLAPGALIQGVVIGWTGTGAADYLAGYALASGQAVSATTHQFGVSNPFTVDTGDPTTVPPGSAGFIYNSTATPFVGLTMANIAPIPEPSSFALAGLGAAALLIFRRRK